MSSAGARLEKLHGTALSKMTLFQIQVLKSALY